MTGAGRPDRSLQLIALLAFFSLGLPDGVLGVAWPSLRRTFALPMSQLGVLLSATMVGYLLSSVASGALVGRLGLGRVLMASSAAMAGSVLGSALAPHWALVVASGIVGGGGAGAIDAGVNAFAAARLSPRLTTWLHASYGLGATLGPLVTGVALATTGSWRAAYAAIGLALALMTVGFTRTASRWTVDIRAARSAYADAPVADVLRRPAIWRSVSLFFVYAGLEVGVGQWAYSWLVEGRQVSPAASATWLALYWGSLTAGRVALGALTTRIGTHALLRASLAAVPVGVIVLWAGAGPTAGAAGLPLLGLALAPIFPLLIATTPDRVGVADATHAIGFQVAAFYLGGAVLPGAAGLLAGRLGLDALGPFLLGTSAAVGLLYGAGGSGQPVKAPAGAEATTGR